MSSIKTINVQNDKVCNGSRTVTRLQYLRVHPHFLLVSNGQVMALFILYENHWDIYTKQQKTMKMKVATEKASSAISVAVGGYDGMKLCTIQRWDIFIIFILCHCSDSGTDNQQTVKYFTFFVVVQFNFTRPFKSSPIAAGWRRAHPVTICKCWARVKLSSQLLSCNNMNAWAASASPVSANQKIPRLQWVKYI